MRIFFFPLLNLLSPNRPKSHPTINKDFSFIHEFQAARISLCRAHFSRIAMSVLSRRQIWKFLSVTTLENNFLCRMPVPTLNQVHYKQAIVFALWVEGCILLAIFSMLPNKRCFLPRIRLEEKQGKASAVAAAQKSVQQKAGFEHRLLRWRLVTYKNAIALEHSPSHSPSLAHGPACTLTSELQLHKIPLPVLNAMYHAKCKQQDWLVWHKE